ncbi:conserved hypothetical protein [Theileria equi strain WA]|uniref:N-alpha-acetyltransferase 40 n=1 Tax=Theileria equi strain WA TaxID=1537102 RepID=L1LD42_THEEQ|nr:conserved hypothetical protein [Theileria equi strain WA]EKX73246.1 conserved hypothetical protein [Theileria equi strain WA]|eukprot:XP_004832698.1 conserved hypothetical protein [Theileria equi strain WA]
MDMGKIKPKKSWNPDPKALEITKLVVYGVNYGQDLGCDQRINTSTPEIDRLPRLSFTHTLSNFKGNTIPHDKLMTIFNLTRLNMRSLYDENDFDGGWNDKKKLGELKYHKTHILIVSKEDLEIIGFASYRFLIMREQQPPTPVCYIYELQIKDEYRGQGLGRFLVQLLEIIAKYTLCKKLMCTVLKANHRALKFYRERCHFSNDESDPNSSYHVLKGIL